MHFFIYLFLFDIWYVIMELSVFNYSRNMCNKNTTFCMQVLCNFVCKTLLFCCKRRKNWHKWKKSFVWSLKRLWDAIYIFWCSKCMLLFTCTQWLHFVTLCDKNIYIFLILCYFELWLVLIEVYKSFRAWVCEPSGVKFASKV